MWPKNDVKKINYITLTDDEISNQHYKNNPLYDQIDELLNDDQNIIQLTQLQRFSKISYNYDYCIVLAEIILDKINQYKIEGQKFKKLFKILVLTDYLLLNGVAAFVDLFVQEISLFEEIEKTKIKVDVGLLNQTELQYLKFIKRKAAHIKDILSNKEKRLFEKELLKNTKLKLMEVKKLNLPNTGQNQTDEDNSILRRIEKYLSQKLQKIANRLIKILDQDALKKCQKNTRTQIRHRKYKKPQNQQNELKYEEIESQQLSNQIQKASKLRKNQKQYRKTAQNPQAIFKNQQNQLT